MRPRHAEVLTMSATAADVWRGRDILDFYSLALGLWGRRWAIVTASALGAAVALLAAFLTTPLYRAQAVLVSTASQRVSLGYSMATQQPSLSSVTNAGSVTALARLGGDTSRAATEEAIATLL